MTDQTATTRAAAALLAAEEDRDKAIAALIAARKVRDDLKAERDRIYVEMNAALVNANAVVRDAAADLMDAEDFVRRLTPRKPRRPRDFGHSVPVNGESTDDDNADA